MFRKLKRVWSYNTYKSIPNFMETFPELNKISYSELCERWKSLGVTLYTEELTIVSKWNRLTLPFALILMLLMFIGLPFVFMITGKWSYGHGKNSRILNWFRSLNLM